MMACVHAHVVLVCCLVRRGARVDQQDHLGCAAVTWAAHVDCTPLPRHCPAWVRVGFLNRTDSRGWPRAGRDALAVCLHAGAYWGTVDVYGQTPLHAAVAAGAVKCVQLLCWVGAEPEVVDKGGWSPRIVAKWLRQRRIQLGGKVNLKTYRAETLMYAVTRRRPALAGCALSHPG